MDSSTILLGLDTKDGVVVLAFDQENELATKGTTERRSTSPSVNRTEPEKEEEKKWFWTSLMMKRGFQPLSQDRFPNRQRSGTRRNEFKQVKYIPGSGEENPVNIKSKKEEDIMRDLMKAGNDQIRD